MGRTIGSARLGPRARNPDVPGDWDGMGCPSGFWYLCSSGAIGYLQSGGRSLLRVICAGANACHCVGVCLLFLGLAFVGLVARVPGYVDFDVLGLYEL